MLPLFLIVLVDLIGFGLVIPLLPFYAERFQAEPFTVTCLMAVFSLAQFITTPFLGRLSDRIGRRPVLIASTAGAAVAYVWLGLADSLLTLFVARAFAGALAGNISAAFAYVADITAPADRSKGMGVIGSAIGLGFIIGPAIGGMLAGSDAASADYATPCLVAAGLSALAFVLTLALLKESRPAGLGSGEARRNALVQIWHALKVPAIGSLVALLFLATFVFAGMEATFALWSERRFGWGPMQNGYFFAALGIVTVIVQGGLVGRMSRRFGERALVIAGAVLFAAGLILTPMAGSVAELGGAMTLLALGFGIFNPALNALLSLRVAAGEQGTILGSGRSAAILGRVVGPGWAGFLFASFGIDWPFIGGAVLMAGVVLAATILVHAPDRPGPAR